MNPVVIIVDLSSFGDVFNLYVESSTFIQQGVPLFTIKKREFPDAKNELVVPVV